MEITVKNNVEMNSALKNALLDSDAYKDLSNVLIENEIKDFFLVLNEKEREVVTKRFSLTGQSRQTLEMIGKHFGVTRERIRQIEKIALGKLRRTISSSILKHVNFLTYNTINHYGGVLKEENILAYMVELLELKTTVQKNIIRLLLYVNNQLDKTEKSNRYFVFWRQVNIEEKDVRSIIDTSINVLKKKGDVIEKEKLVTAVKSQLSNTNKVLSSPLILSSLTVDVRIKIVPEGVGLMSWRHINPKSIRDKAYIVLKKIKKPLHFMDIAKKIEESDFDKKKVTTQAVHNELIRYEQFVLVGRGLYALKEWGYEKGTVSSIIKTLLRNHSPLTKHEIMKGVLAQRQVKKGTISLNLQKNPEFVRVGRALYALNSSDK